MTVALKSHGKNQWESIINDQDSDVFLLRRYERAKQNESPDLNLVNAIENELQSRGWRLDNEKEWHWK
tara:strand:- start:880 stop:1083 length:204 start_codon:yes stop_codon:yes gene_type:complete